MPIDIVDAKEMKFGKDSIANRECCYPKHDPKIDRHVTYVDKKTGVAIWRKEIDSTGKWTGNYYCESCSKKAPRDCRNKETEKDSNIGKGFRIEQVIAKTLGIKNCNLELNNFNAVFDLYDPIKYKEIQSRSVKPSIRKSTWRNKEYFYDVWHVRLDLPEYDTLFIVCMDANYKNIERMYAIPADKLPDAKGITIYKNPSNSAWYEKYRIDEKPFNDTYHSLKIEDCPVIKNE